MAVSRHHCEARNFEFEEYGFRFVAFGSQCWPFGEGQIGLAPAQRCMLCDDYLRQLGGDQAVADGALPGLFAVKRRLEGLTKDPLSITIILTGEQSVFDVTQLMGKVTVFSLLIPAPEVCCHTHIYLGVDQS